MSRPLKQKTWTLQVPENAQGLVIHELEIGSMEFNKVTIHMNKVLWSRFLIPKESFIHFSNIYLPKGYKLFIRAKKPLHITHLSWAVT